MIIMERKKYPFFIRDILLRAAMILGSTSSAKVALFVHVFSTLAWKFTYKNVGTCYFWD